MNFARLSAVFALALLSACATPYQPEGATGGFTETQLDYNVFRVSFRGNGFTSPERADDLTLLRSAQLALSNGFNYFSVVAGNSRLSVATAMTPTVGVATVRPGRIATTLIGGFPLVIEKPSTTNTIFCFEDRPAGGFSYDARFLAASISKKYGLAEAAPRSAVPAVVAVANAQPAPAVASARPVAAKGLRPDQRLPFVRESRQGEWARYVAKPNPKAFAIAENGHYAWAAGPGGREAASTDPKERAMSQCLISAGAPCELYAVDDAIVFRSR